MEAIKKMFTPEFRNRLDGIIQFKPLDANIIKGVVDKFFAELQVQLEDKRVVLHLTDAARTWFAEKGYDEHMGARPMKRLIQEKLKKPLAEMILFGELAEEGGEVEIGVDAEGEISVEVTSCV
jgi:ATP-dependent Clp protease ATP-binding subunit ClpA